MTGSLIQGWITMIARRFAGFGVCLGALVFAGCQSEPTPPTVVQAPATKQPVAVAAPTTAPVEPVTVDSTTAVREALSQKTAAYARSFEPAVAEKPQPKPSAVKWENPKPPKVSTNTPAVLPAPQTAPPVAPADSAQVAALAESAKINSLTDVPAIAPETTDFTNPSAARSADPFEQRIAQRVHDNPADMSAQLDAQLLAVLEDNSAPAFPSTTALAKEDQEVLAALVDGLINLRTGIRQDSNMLLSKKIQPLLNMADRLRSEAELSVPTVALCTRVDGFGNYEMIDPPRFAAGAPIPMLVYCEIENFASTLNDQRQWETKLTQNVTIFTETGMLVWKEKSWDVLDTCRNRRHDFFLHDKITLPSDLSIGRYILKETIVDRIANRIAEKTVPVEIVAKDAQ
jgi:hypothetical protein